MNVEIVSFRNRSSNVPVAPHLLIMMALEESRAWHIATTMRAANVRCWALSDVANDAERLGRLGGLGPAELLRPSEAARMLAVPALFAEGPLHIAVDVSCMPRSVMATLFAALFSLAKTKDMTLTVLYALAAYTPPPESLPPNEEIRPVHPAFAGWPSDVASSTTIIVALGYEKYKAEGANEYFDPAETWVFMPRSPIIDYDMAVEANNKEFIEAAEREGRRIDYSVEDPERTFGELVRIASSARARATPLILPFGPKIFFAISLFVSLLYDEIGVWLISGGDLSLASSNHVASGSVIAFDVTLRPRTADSADTLTG